MFNKNEGFKKDLSNCLLLDDNKEKRDFFLCREILFEVKTCLIFIPKSNLRFKQNAKTYFTKRVKKKKNKNQSQFVTSLFK